MTNFVQLTQDQLQKNQQEFCKILRSTGRSGVDELIKWMMDTDFFTAPASTQFHENFDGGLVVHSLRVNENMHKLYSTYAKGNVKLFSKSTLDIVSLLHDLCKTNYYVKDTRNVKDEVTGQWVKKPYYKVDDKFPMGHGEKSVWMIERFVRLSPEEALAIRWHMGAYDSSFKGGDQAYNNARRYSPLVDLLHAADNFTALMLGPTD